MERRDAIKNMALTLGYTVSAGTISSIITSCAGQPKANWIPKVFSREQAYQLEEFAEMILPKTDTPGAKDVGVAQFIDSFVANVFDAEAKKSYLQEFDAFMADCKKITGSAFENASYAKRAQFLDKQEGDNPKQNPRIWGSNMAKSPEKNFFGKLKDFVNWGYFSSEEIAEKVLSYDPIPGRWDPCIPVGDVGRSWSI